MSDSMIALSVLVVGLGLYATHQHSVIVRYRRWSQQVSALLTSNVMKELEIDLTTKEDSQ